MRRILSAISAASLVGGSLTACGDDAGGEWIRLLSPLGGQVVSVPFDVMIETSVPLGPPHEGLHHVHIWFGDDVAGQTIGEGSVVRISNAPDGEHEMHVSLRFADHSAAGAEVSASIVISGGVVG